mmetsp:Transcript_38440/g.115231  ORF Transcript_38440/g.115231 Transcript_38440/m.115231 type:complete len:307 (+) Transcript_38440:126-1046(+)
MASIKKLEHPNLNINVTGMCGTIAIMQRMFSNLKHHGTSSAVSGPLTLFDSSILRSCSTSLSFAAILHEFISLSSFTLFCSFSNKLFSSFLFFSKSSILAWSFAFASSCLVDLSSKETMAVLLSFSLDLRSSSIELFACSRDEMIIFALAKDSSCFFLSLAALSFSRRMDSNSSSIALIFSLFSLAILLAVMVLTVSFPCTSSSSRLSVGSDTQLFVPSSSMNSSSSSSEMYPVDGSFRLSRRTCSSLSFLASSSLLAAHSSLSRLISSRHSAKLSSFSSFTASNSSRAFWAASWCARIISSILTC